MNAKPGRPRTGRAAFRARKWYAIIVLRSGKQHWEPVIEAEEATSEDRARIKQVSKVLQEKHDAGAWSPDGSVVSPSPDTSAGEWCAAWSAKQTYESAPLERDAVERYFARSPFASLPLKSFTKASARSWVRWLREQPSAQGGALAPRTIRNVFSTVSRAFREAKNDDIIALNPLDAAVSDLPRIADKKTNARDQWPFSWAEVEAILNCPDIPADRRVLHAIRFATGMRPSELFVLRWSDWDRQTEPLTRLNVTRAAKSVSREEGRTKTGARKPCPVHPRLAPVLEHWWSKGWAEHYGRAPALSDFIVPSSNLRPRDLNESLKQFRADCTRAGVEARHQHATRHTFVSRGIDDGADPATLKWVTHAPPKSAFDGYSRAPWNRLCDEIVKLRFPGVRESFLAGFVAESKPTEETLVRAKGLEPYSPAAIRRDLSPIAGNHPTNDDGSRPGLEARLRASGDPFAPLELAELRGEWSSQTGDGSRSDGRQ